MSNRFVNEQKDHHRRQIWTWLYIVVFLIIAALFFSGLSYLGRTSVDNQQESLESALHRDILQCYSIEGMYPPSLDYMKQHYGLSYDESLFFVDYQPIGSNIYPDVTVIRLKN